MIRKRVLRSKRRIKRKALRSKTSNKRIRKKSIRRRQKGGAITTDMEKYKKIYETKKYDMHKSDDFPFDTMTDDAYISNLIALVISYYNANIDANIDADKLKLELEWWENKVDTDFEEEDVWKKITKDNLFDELINFWGKIPFSETEREAQIFNPAYRSMEDYSQRIITQSKKTSTPAQKHLRIGHVTGERLAGKIVK